MKIGYVVGSLGRGGAELQILQLSSGLVARGHDASVLAYGGPGVLDEDFRKSGVEVVAERCASRLQKLRSIRQWMKRVRPDVVHAVQRRASNLSTFARWPARTPALMATDYSSATYGQRTPALWVSLAALALADRVVTEIELNRTNLERLVPWLRGKTLVIRNGLDTERFSPSCSPSHARDGRFAFCVVGTLSAVKNPLRVADAVVELRRRGRVDFRIDWYGRDSLAQRDNTGARARAYVASRGISDHLMFHGDTPRIEHAYRRADALLHASVHEGFPNAVAEGMACGLPIAVSSVADLPLVVAEACNGFVFDQTDALSIADAMDRIMALPADELAAMGARSRALAIRWFNMQRFLDDFEGVYRGLVSPSKR